MVSQGSSKITNSRSKEADQIGAFLLVEFYSHFLKDANVFGYRMRAQACSIHVISAEVYSLITIRKCKKFAMHSQSHSDGYCYFLPHSSLDTVVGAM